LEPHVNGPFTPDLSHSISTLSIAAEKNPSWPTDLSAALIGSCTNSSYEDFTRAASLIKQASGAGLVPKVPLLVAPGSEEIRATLDRDGVLDMFTHDAGGKLLANACGACVGQWERADVVKGQQNSIISSFNRNFVGRQDGNAATHSFVSSPEVCSPAAGTESSALKMVFVSLWWRWHTADQYFSTPS
jgi:aconitate hydratase